MEKQIYNEELIVQYLLGSLSKKETESLDELSFVDDEFAERLSAVENDLVDTYVRGELSGLKLERFDSHYLASPRRRGKVKIARAFQIHMEKAVATGQVVFAPEPSRMNATSVKPFPRLALPQGFFNIPRLVLTAAAILVAFGIGWMVFELSRQRGQVDQARATRAALEQREKELRDLLERQHQASSATERELERVREEKDRLERKMALEIQIAKSHTPALPANLNIATFRLAAPTRTAGQVTTIPLSSGTDRVILQVELEPDDYPSYEAALLTQPGKIPAGWKRERLKSREIGGSKVIDITIPASLLKSQEYLLEVTGISDRGVAEGERGYPFRVVKQ
jgi:hypothetical protein